MLYTNLIYHKMKNMPDAQDLLAIAALSIVLIVLLLRARSKRIPRPDDDEDAHWI